MTQPAKDTPRTPDMHMLLNGLHIGVSNLHELLDALADQMIGMPHMRDGKRDHEMHRATALASVARDIANRLVGDVEGMI